ncbi:MAG: GIY-YIG nuclease family protein [Sulfitobacter sp.]|nr:GIY-YIG nuclease family protein [Sulfitobacter sp.]
MTVQLAGSVKHPKIYAWTDDDHAALSWEGKRNGAGVIKIGYTAENDVQDRIRSSRGIKSPLTKPYQLVLTETAITDNGEVFMDHAVHAELKRAGVRSVPDPAGDKTEWYECTADEARAAIAAIKSSTTLSSLRPRASFGMRPEQEAAVDQTAAYFTANTGDGPAHFLWNAKMRFGKTFTTYQLAKELGWSRVLVLTYKPAVETAWREDLEGHTDFENWRFHGKADPTPDMSDPSPIVWFASFQDVLGTTDGKTKKKNEALYDASWDAVVIDEYHFGAWRDAARNLYLRDARDEDAAGDSSEKKELDTPDLDEDFSTNLEAGLGELDVARYLYLSGTPFRALTQGEFLEDQVYNWTYSDEQRAKKSWAGPDTNPYESLPQMHLLTYSMPDELRKVALNNQSEFSLTEFFRTERTVDSSGNEGPPVFLHAQDVQRWLNVLRGQDITGLWASVSAQNRPPLPYEDLNLLRALQHTVWYMPSVDACHAMAHLLSSSNNKFFADYNIVIAAGKEAGMGALALPPVERVITNTPQDTKSITLSCGKLMTGVTVPAWAGIFMLRELKSPESYFQAAFRVQSPWKSKMIDSVAGGETELVHKERCYVIDFSPNRALHQIVDYATRLRSEVGSERDDEKAIDEFMEFLHVLAFDGYSMQQLNASHVLDFLTSGVSSSMLARRWNSPELLKLDIASMEAMLGNPALLAELEKIEVFRNISNDLTAMISTNKELGKKQVSGDKLTKEEKEAKKDAGAKRDDLKKKLQRFITRLPAFMYLTDDRERAIRDIIAQGEGDMFEKVTGLKLHHFGQLVDAGVFDDNKMNDAVWKFRNFEKPSLSYANEIEADELVGGWSVSRDDLFAQLVTEGILNPGDELTGLAGDTALVSDDYGLIVSGIRRNGPAEAAEAVGHAGDGWEFWTAETTFGTGTLRELADLLEQTVA